MPFAECAAFQNTNTVRRITRQVPSCPYGLCDVVSQRPKGAYSARLVGQNVYREIERETVGTVSNIEKSGRLSIGSRIIGSSPIIEAHIY